MNPYASIIPRHQQPMGQFWHSAGAIGRYQHVRTRCIVLIVDGKAVWQRWLQ